MVLLMETRMSMFVFDASLLLEPCDNRVKGESPIYDEDYIFLKNEIDKLSGADFKLIQNRAYSFLIRKYKDLRVLGYFILSTVILNDFAIVVDVFKIYAEFIKLPNLFPEKVNVQLNAVQFLNSKRFSKILLERTGIITKKEAKQLKSLLESLHKVFDESFGKEAVRLSGFCQFIDCFKIEKDVCAIEETIQENKKNHMAIVQKPVWESTISSKEDVEKVVVSILDYYSIQNDRVNYISISRVLRWAKINPLMISGHRTAIRNPLLSENELNPQYNNKDEAVTAFYRLEKAFLRNGGQCELDLQIAQLKILEMLQDGEAKKCLEFRRR